MKLSVKSFTLVGIAILLFIPFNVSLGTIFFPGTVEYIYLIISLVCIFIGSTGFRPSIHLVRSNRNVYILWIVVLLFVLIRNQDLANSTREQPLFFVVLFIMMLLLDGNDHWYAGTWKIIRFFCVFHMLAGYFLLFNKSLLTNIIVPLFSVSESGMTLLLNCIENGYMTGLCSHYSTMGMYMAIGVISYSGLLFSQNQKRKRVDVIIFLAMILALFLTGKRGPLVFALAAVAIIYVVLNDLHKKKEFKRAFNILIVCVVLFFVAYLAVPQVRVTLERFTNAGNSFNDLTTGRAELMWVYAVSMFKEHPLFGNGWRYFAHNITLLNSSINSNDAHNIYLQLLAEVGILGFIVVLGFMTLAWRNTYRALKLNQRNDMFQNEIRISLILSLIYQTFFLLYGLTGNPLYDRQTYVPYFICCIMGFISYAKIKKWRLQGNN